MQKVIVVKHIRGRLFNVWSDEFGFHVTYVHDCGVREPLGNAKTEEEAMSILYGIGRGLYIAEGPEMP